MSGDLVDYILAAVAETFGEAASPDVLKSIEQDVRSHWSGERCYVAKLNRKSRAAQVREDWKAGCSVSELHSKYPELTERRIRQIINQKPRAKKHA